MKHIVAGLILMLGGLCLLQAESRPHLVIVANQAPPYRILDHGQWHGFYFDVFDLLAQRAGITYEVIEAPVARGLTMLQRGSADLMLGPVHTKEREIYMVFTAATFPAERKVFYVKPDKVKINTWSDLQGLTVSILKGGAYSELFEQDSRIIKDEVSDYLGAIRKVANSRSDAVLMPELQGDALIRSSGVTLGKCPP